jgi:putative IMPACT (imprinted ancient) family translation regulator
LIEDEGIHQIEAIDDEDAEISHSCAWYKCDACAHLHLVLLTDDDMPIATAIIGREMLVAMLQTIDGEPTVKAGAH